MKVQASLTSWLIGCSLLAMTATGAFADVVYNRGNSADPESLDPHKTSTVYEANILRDLFMGLMVQDAKAQVQPGAAESYTVSPDGKTWTFKLRQGAVWSDGSPVTADDFVFSWRRLVDPATASEYAYMLAPVVNAEDITAGKMKPDQLAVKAIDPGTFEVTLKAPTPYFLEMLTHQATYPVSKANVEKLGADFVKPGNLVSNGAYVLKEFVPNDHIKAVKNDKFYDAANVKIDVVNYIPTEDRSTAMKRFEAGELDSNDDLPTEQLADLKTKFGDEIHIGPYLGTYYYVFKTDKKPWDNVKLRQAISEAIDRDYLAEKVWQNTMIPAYSFVPPGVTGYETRTTDYAEKSQLDREDEAWIADYKDPANFLALCKTGTGNNYALYSNADYDGLMAKAAAAASPEDRMKALSDAEAIGVARDLCVMPLLYYSYHDLVSSKLKGWEDNVMDVHPTRFLSKE